MGRNNKVRKFAEMKRMIKARDGRLGPNAKKKKKQQVSKRKLKDGKLIERQLPKTMFQIYLLHTKPSCPVFEILAIWHRGGPKISPGPGPRFETLVLTKSSKSRILANS